MTYSTGCYQASGVTNNGAENGTVLDPDTVGTYYYICRYHGAMVTINATANTSKQFRVATKMVLQYIQMIDVLVNFNDSNMGK